jgi:hypothetical protein
MAKVASSNIPAAALFALRRITGVIRGVAIIGTANLLLMVRKVTRTCRNSRR